jgi:hypothetical protein
MKTKNLPLYILAAIIIIGFFTVLGLLLFKPIPEANQRVLDMLLGALVTCFIAIVMYWFGSSKGSADKTEMMNQK